MTTSRDVLASSPNICPGQISWDYDRAEMIADGVVHAIGVCLGLIGVTMVMIAVNIEPHRNRADYGLCDRPGDDARALGCLQHVAGLARQVGSAPLRPLRDLSIDRRNLHAVPGADEKRSGLSRSRVESLGVFAASF
jgi:hypothetical protein